MLRTKSAVSPSKGTSDRRMYGASTVQIQFGYDPSTIQHRIKNTSFHKKTIFLSFHEKKSITICYL
ncbi:hypothetical protein DWZ09_09615 [Bacteroides cellulosilyticus]|nr:hypothetical protein DWZ09_09615 [Bacteroides cellulosilyticus]